MLKQNRNILYTYMRVVTSFGDYAQTHKSQINEVRIKKGHISRSLRKIKNVYIKFTSCTHIFKYLIL